MSLMLILAMQAAAADRLAVTPRCGPTVEGELLVCGARPDRFHLPLPDERERPVEADHRTATGMAALTPATRCGMFEGERRCGRREAERYGYGRGRDPVTLLLQAGTLLLDPDAEVAGP